ncbi:MAG: PHP domain-containing protein [Saprospiraceae bacterium]|nr:PHP domain-containing protein [Saprospiraceae bacterium]
MADDGDFEKCWLETTGPLHLLQKAPVQENETELGYFDRLGSVYIPPECRTGQIKDLGAFPSNVIRHQDIRGVIHAHSTYSDGLHSVKKMAEESERLGYSYLGITDHSKIAVYADGMDEEKSQQQWAEIDHLNREKREFTILKGIECDILSDGSLDFDDHFRSGFQFVIASVHTNIKMDIDKATSRLITAIEHPQTNILGHPTGRLLLGRDGYPLHIDKVIDACAVNQVAIEINANPYRLDLDWKYIQLAVDKGVQLCINPDAHTKESITNIHFGVIIARKGWLPAESCLNTRNVDDFLAFCEK